MGCACCVRQAWREESRPGPAAGCGQEWQGAGPAEEAGGETAGATEAEAEREDQGQDSRASRSARSQKLESQEGERGSKHSKGAIPNETFQSKQNASVSSHLY